MRGSAWLTLQGVGTDIRVSWPAGQHRVRTREGNTSALMKHSSSLMDKEWLAEWAPLTYRLASPQAAVRWRCQAMTNTPLGVSWHQQAVKLGTNHPKSSQKLQFGTLQKSENIIDRPREHLNRRWVQPSVTGRTLTSACVSHTVDQKLEWSTADAQVPGWHYKFPQNTISGHKSQSRYLF